MHIETVPNRGSPPTVLLRESRRENGKVRKKTLANLSHLPAHKIEALRLAFQGEASVFDTSELEVLSSKDHGGVSAVVQVMKDLIALAGVAVEIGVVMLVYLDQAVKRYREAGRLAEEGGLQAAITDGALRRIRPIAMTVLATTLGLLPIMIGHGTSSQVMKRIAGPMVGGMATTTILTLVVIPVIYRWVQAWRWGGNRPEKRQVRAS